MSAGFLAAAALLLLATVMLLTRPLWRTPARKSLGAHALMDALKHASLMLAELRTSIAPKAYYQVPQIADSR